MKLQMQSVHFDADRKLLAFIQKKADKLDTFFGNIISGDVVLRLQKDETRENKVFEFTVHVPGNRLFAREKATSFEAAADLAVEAMRKQLSRHKDKSTVHKQVLQNILQEDPLQEEEV